MHLEHLWLTDFRTYHQAELVPAASGLTVITGANGQGKTNLLEAIGYLATLRSFRGAPGEALIRVGAPNAVVRASGSREGRGLLIEAELKPTGRDRVQVNRQTLRRTRDLLGALQVTVFAPDDLELVKGGPAGRRRYLDDLLVALHPRHDATQTEVERVLKQRNALLKSAAGRGRPGPDVLSTLDVWDAKLTAAGEALVTARRGLAEALSPLAGAAYATLATGSTGPGRVTVGVRYQPSWSGSLASALAAARDEDLRRGLSTVGPHRDELLLGIGGLPARTHASQGEQRTLALALRLGGHRLVTGRIGSPPILLLDDVFSELDPDRSAALLDSLPEGQALLTTAGALPAGVEAEVTVRVEDGKVLL
ncbi:MAG TPA: DNA replication/repair protein RecF [Acidimicrobiales bacterium]|nr:DNA replication/repair protein RecF [Acidimicrobiales bacterium]